MKISIAQTKPFKGDISANIEKHMMLIEHASELKTNSVFFPELSLTSYEPKLAKQLSIHQEDKRLSDFQQISDTKKIIIGLGVPTKSKSGILISMVVFQPHKNRQTYSKQQLHADEFPYFVCGENQTILTVENIKIAPAICYESLKIDHSENAKKLGAEIYVASVAKSQKGIEKGMMHYPKIAKKYSMPVLMSNCIGPCDNFVGAGLSAVWTKHGKLVGQLDDKNEGILVFDTETEEIIKKII